MNKLTRAVKFGLIVGSLTTSSLVTAAHHNESTKSEAKAFIEAANIEYKEQVETVRLAWYIKDRFTTLDTLNHWNNLMKRDERIALKLAYESAQFQNLELNDDLSRRLSTITTRLFGYAGHPHPIGEANVSQLKTTTDKLVKAHNTIDSCGEQTDDKSTCLDAAKAAEKMASSSDEVELRAVWEGWHNNLAPLKPLYQQQIAFNNDGAKRFGFANRAEMELSEFELPADQLIADLDQVWIDIKPLYDSLITHIRHKLTERYGAEIVTPHQPIPAHLLGSLDASNFSNLYDLVKPEGAVTDRGYNIEAKLKTRPELDLPTILRGYEQYLTTLGFTPFKASLYEFSQFEKPQHHKAACDPAAWWFPENNEARVAGCDEVTARNFMRYNTTALITPTYHRASHAKQPGHYSQAPSGFIRGAARALQYAYTPEYLQKIGMLDHTPDPSQDLGHLMQLALRTVANLPYKLVINKWQKEVAGGDISENEYNKRWWQLREHYQGISAPSVRSDKGFDAGANAAVIHNQAQTGGFIGEVLGFQFYQSLCEAKGNKNSLSRCSFYGSKEVGDKLNAMFELGNSKPWYEVMAAVTGQSKLDGKAVVNYFKPLQEYLEKQNKSYTFD